MNVLSVKPTTGGSSVATGPSGSILTSSAAEKNKQWQRELLMERIRSHSSQHKSFQELSKSMRMSMLEKRYALDAVEKSNLQKCLDSMQHCIKVTSRQGLVERLESLSRQLGLKFMEDTSGLFISTDMFFLEIILDANGSLTDVKVHHECKIEQQSCSELVNCLNRGDFADFTVQLEGLSSIYQLNAEPKVKTKAFVALQAMETDLYNLFQMQHFTKDTQQLLEESTVGIVLKRRGGHPMKLTYFVSPYDLISLEGKCLQPLSIDLITSKNIGMSVTVNLEAASANKLQILPTVTFAKDTQTGVEKPVYAPLTQLNSTLLPATFVLTLNKPLPVCSATLRSLLSTSTTSTTCDGTTTTVDQKSTVPTTGSPVSTIMNLIVQTASEQQLKNSSKGLFVCLPDQTHCYFFTDNKQLKASLVTSVPFTEPSQVPTILAFLKKQALFYTLLSSCVRPQTKMGNDMDSTTILEVNAISFQQISVSLQHPYEESMATVEFNLNDSSVNCIIYSMNRNYDLLSIKLTKIVQKSQSIPVTIRALLKFWDQERFKLFQRGIGQGTGGGNSCTQGNNNAFGNFSLNMGPNDPGGRGGGGGNGSGITKMETNISGQRQFVGSSTAAAGVAGYLKFKTDIKQEDFHESPKSQTQTQMQSVVASSLGQSIHQQQHQQTADLSTLTSAPGMSKDIEIADKYKNIWKDKTPNLKNSVSITPIISANSLQMESKPQAPQSLDIKRTGIEIIPLMTQSSTGVGSCTASSTPSSSTITITPINSGSSSSKSDKKSVSSSLPTASSSSSSSKRSLDSSSTSGDPQKEKKRKKKRDDSPMGPPEKVFSRQNSPATTTGPEAVARKFSSPASSPKGASGGMLATTSGSSLSARPSPKHSPVYSSPKHSTASNSPKSPFSTHSPKHGSSGKPSMSTLKSAAASLSPKVDKSSSMGSSGTNASATTTSALVRSLTGAGNTAVSGFVQGSGSSSAVKSRDKEKGMTAASGILSSAAIGKPNTASVSLQQMKSTSSLNHVNVAGNMGDAFNTVGGSGGAGTATSLDSMRKGVSGAVSLMTSTTASAATTHHQLGNIDTNQQQTTSTSSEYMVKQSQEGLKLTINKTSNKSSNKMKSSSSSSSSSALTVSASSRSPTRKQHTGLKPGVNSGPASAKKSPASSPAHSAGGATSVASSASSSGSSTTTTTTSTTGKIASHQTTKHIFQKSNSSGNLSSKLSSTATSTSSSATAASGRGGNSSSGSNSQAFPDYFRKSGSSAAGKKGSMERDRDRERSSTSQPATRLDHQADMMKILQYASPTMAANMEGFMKNLSTKFQIPKLSQRSTTPTTTSTATPSSTAPAVAATTAQTMATGSSKVSSSSSTPTTPTNATTASFFNAVTGSSNSNKVTNIRPENVMKKSPLALGNAQQQQQQQQQHSQQQQQHQHQQQHPQQHQQQHPQQQHPQQHQQQNQQQHQQQQQHHPPQSHQQQQQHQQQQHHPQQSQSQQQQQQSFLPTGGLPLIPPPQPQQQQPPTSVADFQRTNDGKPLLLPSTSRPPPPPYHAAIAAAAAAAAANTTGVSTAAAATTSTQPSLSVHILKSPATNVAAAAAVAAASVAGEASDHSDLTANVATVAEDALLAAASVVGK